MFTREFDHKPSIRTLRSAAARAANEGYNWIQFTWGENQITLEKDGRGWYGSGWIGRTGGYDLAEELRRA